jgi:hypothetical protein
MLLICLLGCNCYSCMEWEVHLAFADQFVICQGFQVTGLALQESLYFRYQHVFESIHYSIRLYSLLFILPSVIVSITTHSPAQ